MVMILSEELKSGDVIRGRSSEVGMILEGEVEKW